MSSREEQKTETRRRLLTEAARLVAERGFAQTRTADVARAAGVSHGAVFVHFPSRDDLVREVTAQLGKDIIERLHARASGGGSLREVLSAHLKCIEERADLYRHLLLEGPFLPEEFRASWVAIQSAISFHISQAAEREMQAGRIRRVPVHLLFNTWIGLLHHYLANRELFAPGASVLAVHGRALLKHFLGLLAP